MSGNSPAIIPTLRYEDAPKAIDWLCQAFGFEKHMVVPDDKGGIAHAQLTFRGSMIMLGSADEGEWSQQVKPPKQLGGNSQSPYVIVEDCKAHYAQAKAAGAEIVMDLEDKDYGGSGYTCTDLEGHVWSFGDYDPLAD